MIAPADGNVIDDAARKRKRLAQNTRAHRIRRSRGEQAARMILTERHLATFPEASVNDVALSAASTMPSVTRTVTTIVMEA